MRHKTEIMKLSEQGIIREEALLAYANNELSAEEKLEFEKLLKDDSFAQEALEGLQEAKKANVAATVISINKKIRTRSGLKEGRSIKLHWSNYAWAAVVLGLLIGVGFLMVTFLSKPDSSIAMNKKAEEPVTLMEKKAEEPNLTSATAPVVTDSITVSEQKKVAADESVAKPNQPTETKKADDIKAGASKQEPIAISAAPSPAITNSTQSKDAAKTTIVSKEKNKQEVAVNANRLSNSDTKTENKPVAKDESVKKNVAQRNEDKATETIEHGAVAEKISANKVTAVTMDDAMKSFNGGDYKTSSEQFTEILKQQPNNTDALYFGGISDYINGNTKKSEKNFDKLLKDGTKFSEGSKWYKANILLKKGKRDEAKKILDELANSGSSYKERAVKKRAEMEF